MNSRQQSRISEASSSSIGIITADDTHQRATATTTTTTGTTTKLSSKSLEQLDDDAHADDDDDASPAAAAAPFACEHLQLCISIGLAHVVTANRVFLRLVWPSCQVQFLRNLIQNVGFVIAGRYLDADREMPGYVLGYSAANMLGVASIMGISSVLDSLCTVCVGAAGPRSPQLGLHLRTALATAAAFSLAYFVVVWFALPPMLAGVGKPALVEPAMSFTAGSVLLVFGTGCASSIHKFLNACHKTQLALYGYVVGAFASLVAVAAVILFGTPTVFLLSLVVGVGRISAALAMLFFGFQDDDVSAAIGDLRDVESWRRALRLEVLAHFTELCVPSIIASAADRWTFEVLLMFIATRAYAPTYADAFGTLTTIWIFGFCMGGVGAYVAASTLVGGALGAGNAQRASAAAWQSLRFVVGSSVASALLFLVFANQVLSFFISDDGVVRLCKKHTLLFACGYVADSLGFALSGTFRAMGRVKLVSRIALVSQWLVTIPIAYLLVVHTHGHTFGGLFGLGLALNLGLWVQFGVFMIFLGFADWEVLAFTTAAAQHQHHPHDDGADAAAPGIREELDIGLGGGVDGNLDGADVEELDLLEADRRSQGSSHGGGGDSGGLVSG